MPADSLPASPTRGVSYLYMAAAFVVVVAGMRAAEPILNPLLLAVFLAVISAPAYFGLLKRKYSNWLALLIVMGVLSAVVLGFGFVVLRSIAGFTARHQHYAEQWNDRQKSMKAAAWRFVPEWVEEQVEGSQPNPQRGKVREDTEPQRVLPEESHSRIAPVTENAALESSAEESGEENEGEKVNVTEHLEKKDELPMVPARLELGVSQERELPKDEKGWLGLIWEQFDPLSLARTIAESIGLLLSNTFLVLLTVIFILLEAGTFPGKIRKAFSHNGQATARAEEIIQSMQSYIVLKTWLSLATGVLIAVWLWFLGVPYFALWGLFAFLFNFIPNIGSIIAAVPAVLIAWLDLTMLPAVAAAIGFLLVNTVVGNFVEPRLMGKGLGLSPLIVFFSMVFWGWVLGPLGMLLSVPLTMTARIALDGFEDTRWIATLLGNADTT